MFKSKKKRKALGGVVFLTSFAVLVFLALLNFVNLPALWDSHAKANWVQFLMGFISGFFVAGLVIRGHISVFLHEFKHALLSGLVGNKAKGLIVKGDSGRFSYSYTKETEHYNAFISLAPYWFPLFTLPVFIVGLFFVATKFTLFLLLLGVAYGIDCRINVRDISPIQTDFSNILGGFLVGLGYVIAMNAVIFSIVSAWVSQGFFGLKYLLYGLWRVVVNLIAYYFY